MSYPSTLHRHLHTYKLQAIKIKNSLTSQINSQLTKLRIKQSIVHSLSRHHLISLRNQLQSQSQHQHHQLQSLYNHIEASIHKSIKQYQTISTNTAQQLQQIIDNLTTIQSNHTQNYTQNPPLQITMSFSQSRTTPFSNMYNPRLHDSQQVIKTQEIEKLVQPLHTVIEKVNIGGEYMGKASHLQQETLERVVENIAEERVSCFEDSADIIDAFEEKLKQLSKMMLEQKESTKHWGPQLQNKIVNLTKNYTNILQSQTETRQTQHRNIIKMIDYMIVSLS